MSDRLEWMIETKEELTCVKLMGPINEDSDFVGLLRLLSSSPWVRMDLAGVPRINSCGVREWVNFVRELPEGLNFELENCSPSIINQVNMISNFVGTAKILSVQAPFVCPECTFEARFELQVQQGLAPDLPTMSCPQCSSMMEFDDLEDSYFFFLTR